MKYLRFTMVTGALLLGLAALGVAQDNAPATTTTTPAQSDAKSDMKAAGHETKQAAKHTGHAVKKTTKKVVHKGARKTRRGAEKVEDKTAPPQ